MEANFSKAMLWGALLAGMGVIAACSSPANDVDEPRCGTAGVGGGSGGGATVASGGEEGTGGDTEGSDSPYQPDVSDTVYTDSTESTNFHHPMGEGEVVNGKDPFQVLQERADEGPPNVRSRLHSCARIPYASLGALLTSRGVDLNKKSSAGELPTAGELYAGAVDALGAPRFDARQAESFTYTVAGGTKLFDIFFQASSEIIANIATALDCSGQPLFDAALGECVPSAFTCLMGRPPKDEDMILCNMMIADAAPEELDNRRKLVVATFLAAAHTCE